MSCKKWNTTIFSIELIISVYEERAEAGGADDTDFTIRKVAIGWGEMTQPLWSSGAWTGLTPFFWCAVVGGGEQKLVALCKKLSKGIHTAGKCPTTPEKVSRFVSGRFWQ